MWHSKLKCHSKLNRFSLKTTNRCNTHKPLNTRCEKLGDERQGGFWRDFVWHALHCEFHPQGERWGCVPLNQNLVSESRGVVSKARHGPCTWNAGTWLTPLEDSEVLETGCLLTENSEERWWLCWGWLPPKFKFKRERLCACRNRTNLDLGQHVLAWSLHLMRNLTVFGVWLVTTLKPHPLPPFVPCTYTSC